MWFYCHNAKLGCNKCLKEFITDSDKKTDFSGYDRDNWTSRTNEQHRQQCSLLLKEVTPTAIQNFETTSGVRYSILLTLPYFDPVRYTVIDPMHNLFLGTGKNIFKVWIEQGFLDNQALTKIESKIKAFSIPTGVGRLPYNISSAYGGFTANQWSNWITIYSPVVLKGVLPDQNLRSWLLFVRACSILRKRILTKQDVVSADLYLLQFCQSFEELYGSAVCTPNMHLHLHPILDFGPPQSFWCYAFERYNGILGSVHTNRRSIESQLMQTFCQEQDLNNLTLPSHPEFQSLLAHLSKEPTSNSLSAACQNDTEISSCLTMANSPLSNIASFSINVQESLIKLLPPFQEKILTTAHSSQLQLIYEQLYPGACISHFPLFYQQFGRIEIAGDIVGSVKRGQNSQSSSVVMSYWPGTGDKLEAIDYGRMRVGVVQYYLKHTIELRTSSDKSQLHTHIFCYVYWKKLHPHTTWYGISATVCTDLTEEPDACSFMPVQRIACRCAYARVLVDIYS